MDADDIEATLGAVCLIEHALEYGSTIIEDETKNREPIDFELPAETTDILSWYVREHRPAVLREPSSALFPGKGGKAKSSGLLATQIGQTVVSTG